MGVEWWWWMPLHNQKWEQVAGDDHGPHPVEADVNPAAVAVTAELGMDLHVNGARPKRLEEVAVQA